jgi:hypothetical protein
MSNGCFVKFRYCAICISHRSPDEDFIVAGLNTLYIDIDLDVVMSTRSSDTLVYIKLSTRSHIEKNENCYFQLLLRGMSLQLEEHATRGRVLKLRAKH